MSGGQNPLAYGRYYDGREDEAEGQRGGDRGLSDTARGFLSDGLKKLKDQYGTSHGQGQGQQQQQQNYYSGSATGQSQSYQSGSYNQQQQPPPPSNTNRPPKQDKLSSFLDRFEETVTGVGSQLAQKIGTTIDADAYAGYGSSSNANSRNRFGSFAPVRESNDVKWHVDGFTYFWAVSRALETARESIWILDCMSL
jgi:phospholipase D1/2